MSAIALCFWEKVGDRLCVFLSAAEDRTLFELRTATTVPQRVKDRAEVVRLSHQGMYVEQIAALFRWHERTVRETFISYQLSVLLVLHHANPAQ